MRTNQRKRVTLQDVAKHAGVSRSTASLIVRGSSGVSEKSRKKVLKSIDQLGYVYDRVAANLRLQNSFMVSLIIPEISNPLFSELSIGVQEKLEEKGYTVILGTTYDSPDKQDYLLSKMFEYRVDGVIMSPSPQSAKYQSKLKQWGIPVVLVTRDIEEYDFDYVGIDNVLGAELATEHLIKIGHRRIAFLGGVDDSSRKERMKGYINALNKADIAIDESLFIESNEDINAGINLVEKVVNQTENPPTAAFCYNDIIALGFMYGLKRQGIIPGEDFAVVGFDDIRDATISSPSLTTVAGLPELIGRQAANVLLQRMKGKNLSRQRIILKPELIIRDSAI